MMQDVLDRFLAAESDVYLILQLKDCPETRDERYASMWLLEQMDMPPNPAHYEVVYFANTPAYLYGMSDAAALEELFIQFNVNHPADFKGHSLSVSDVIALKRQGQVDVFYVDSFGFKELPGFLDRVKEAARQKPVAEKIRQAKEAALPVKAKKHKERDAR